MAFILSTGLRNALLGKQDSIVGTTLAITNATTITDSGNGFLTAGFRPGDTLVFTGWTEAGNNTVICTAGTVTAGSLTVSGTTLTIDAGGVGTETITAVGKSFKDIFRNGVIRIYSGSAPATADAQETGTLLLKITESSGAFTAGNATNGLNFDAIASGVLSKEAVTHSGVGLVDGTAAYYRLYDNGEITLASTTSKRCQGTVGTSGTQFILSSTSIVSLATTTLDTHNITQPAS